MSGIPNLSASTILVCLLSAVGGVVPTCASFAGEPKWAKGTYDYVVVDEDLRSVLQHFGANNGVRIVLSDKVQGHVHGRLQSAPPRDFLNGLTKQFGLDWYYDGAAIWISATSEAATKLMPLRGIPIESLGKSLVSSNLQDARFPLRAGLGPNTAIISGPPRYLAMTDDVLTALVAGLAPPIALKPGEKRTVTVFRGPAVNQVEFP